MLMLIDFRSPESHFDVAIHGRWHVNAYMPVGCFTGLRVGTGERERLICERLRTYHRNRKRMSPTKDGELYMFESIPTQV